MKQKNNTSKPLTFILKTSNRINDLVHFTATHRENTSDLLWRWPALLQSWFAMPPPRGMHVQWGISWGVMNSISFLFNGLMEMKLIFKANERLNYEMSQSGRWDSTYE